MVNVPQYVVPPSYVINVHKSRAFAAVVAGGCEPPAQYIVFAKVGVRDPDPS